MAVEPTNNDDVQFICDECGRVATYSPNPFGPTEESARVAGWRIGSCCGGKKLAYCPVCAGTDAGFWDRRTLGLAAQAGVQSGWSR